MLVKFDRKILRLKNNTLNGRRIFDGREGVGP